MQSMTGFGRSDKEIDGRAISIELKCVNHRFLDINIRMPRFLGLFEEFVRQTVRKRLNRGRADVFINYQSSRDDAKSVDINMAVIRAYLSAAEDIEMSAGIENDITMSDMLNLPETVKVRDIDEDEEALKELIGQALNDALDMVVNARTKEGAGLKKDISMRLDILKSLTSEIEGKSDTVVQEYKEKLEQRLKDLIGTTELDENRFNTEVAIFADKCNITEEIVRLKTHLETFMKDLDKQGPCGRRFDFLVQEINREFNTIGSKSSDVDITNNVLEAKSELEKIREQIQNIE